MLSTGSNDPVSHDFHLHGFEKLFTRHFNSDRKSWRKGWDSNPRFYKARLIARGRAILAGLGIDNRFSGGRIRSRCPRHRKRESQHHLNG